MQVESRDDLRSIPELADLQRKQFADAQAGADAENDHGLIAQGIFSFQIRQGPF